MSRFSTGRDIFMRILVRWIVNSFGLWLAGQLLSNIDFQNDLGVILLSGLVLSLVNAAIKPLVIILSLPAIVFSLGIFMIFVNGLMVYLVGSLVEAYEVETFGAAVLAGIIIGLVNYAMTTALEERYEEG